MTMAGSKKERSYPRGIMFGIGLAWSILGMLQFLVQPVVSSQIIIGSQIPTNVRHYLRGSTAMSFNDPSSSSRRNTVVSTNNCGAERRREDYYTAELHLYYVYSVEFEPDASSNSPPSLTGMEAAITSAVSDAFMDACDLLDRPMYKVKTNMRHQFSKDGMYYCGRRTLFLEPLPLPMHLTSCFRLLLLVCLEFCAPLSEGDICSVVDGATAILLDRRSANIQDAVYDAIADGLNNLDLVVRFAPSVVRAEFRDPVRETLISSVSPNDASLADEDTPPGAVTATVAVAAASVSFLVASIFCYGLMRREIRHHPEPSIRHKFRRSSRSIVGGQYPLGLGPSSRSSRRFVRLDELAAAHAYKFSMGGMPMHGLDEDDDDDLSGCGSYHENNGLDNNGARPSITWSISDITSDSISLRSGVSWTTSRLDRIEEADEEEDEYDAGDLPNHHRKRKRIALMARKARTSTTTTGSPTKQSRPTVEVVGLDKIQGANFATSNNHHNYNSPLMVDVAVSQHATGVPEHHHLAATATGTINIRSITPESVEGSPCLSPLSPIMPEVFFECNDEDTPSAGGAATPREEDEPHSFQADDEDDGSSTLDDSTLSVYLVPLFNDHEVLEEPRKVEPEEDDANANDATMDSLALSSADEIPSSDEQEKHQLPTATNTRSEDGEYEGDVEYEGSETLDSSTLSNYLNPYVLDDDEEESAEDNAIEPTLPVSSSNDEEASTPVDATNQFLTNDTKPPHRNDTTVMEQDCIVSAQSIAIGTMSADNFDNRTTSTNWSVDSCSGDNGGAPQEESSSSLEAHHSPSRQETSAEAFLTPEQGPEEQPMA
jgi:hypothetical protein